MAASSSTTSRQGLMIPHLRKSERIKALQCLNDASPGLPFAFAKVACIISLIYNRVLHHQNGKNVNLPLVDVCRKSALLIDALLIDDAARHLAAITTPNLRQFFSVWWEGAFRTLVGTALSPFGQMLFSWNTEECEINNWKSVIIASRLSFGPLIIKILDSKPHVITSPNLSKNP